MPGLGTTLPSSYQPGTMPGGTALDGPPPSPAVATGQNTGQPLGDMGGGALTSPMGVPADQMPIPILTGMMQVIESTFKTLQGFAQTLPQFQAKIGAVNAALLDLSADLMTAGAGPTSPVNAGPQFPGGGMDKGGGPPSLA